MLGTGRLAGPAAGKHSVPVWSLALPVAVVLLAAVIAVAMVELNQASRTPWVAPGTAEVGATAPDFSSWDLNGAKVSLSDYKGKPVVLSFWATSCTACQAEFPALQKVQDRYAAQGLAVLAVDYRETDTTRMASFLGGLHVAFRPVLDPQGTIAYAYGVDVGLPVNVWLDRSHRVTQVMVGEQQPSDLAAAAAKVAA